MITYRDRTFCTAACGTTWCPLMLTDDIRKDAERLGLPVARADMHELCDDYTPGDRLLQCDWCGSLHRDTLESLSESCECGRFKQRMDYA